jgi:hypothetical protein
LSAYGLWYFAINGYPRPLNDSAKKEGSMQFSSRLRSALFALAALAGVGLASAALTSAVYADSGNIQFKVIKGGWVIGASGGSGTLFFQGNAYPISIGGISAGIVFGASETWFRGTVSHINRPSDVAGVYVAGGAGGAVGGGAQVIVLTNEKGAVLTLSGHQVGLQINADLSGLVISLR